MTDGERLKLAREVAGLSGTAVADELGISAGSYYLYERGGAEPKVTTALRIAAMLEVPADTIWSIG